MFSPAAFPGPLRPLPQADVVVLMRMVVGPMAWAAVGRAAFGAPPPGASAVVAAAVRGGAKAAGKSHALAFHVRAVRRDGVLVMNERGPAGGAPRGGGAGGGRRGAGQGPGGPPPGGFESPIIFSPIILFF